jgi:hypothetical protein
VRDWQSLKEKRLAVKPKAGAGQRSAL